jgi:hypothetical protein
VIRLLLIALALGLGGTLVIQYRERRRLERVAAIRAMFLAARHGPPEHLPPLKEVWVRDGTVRFRVPQAWAEEYPDDHSALFYDRGGGRRVLHVTGTTVPVSPASIADALRARAQEPTTLETLPSGDLLLKSLSAARERDGDVVRFAWLLGQALSADTARFVSFTLTVPFAAARDVFTRDDLIRIEHEVRAARLGRV